MKKKTFFYKFDKNRETPPVSNHNFLSEKDNEDNSGFKISKLLSKEGDIINSIEKAEESFPAYYEARRLSKIKAIESIPNNEKIQEHFTKENYYIISIKFGKALSDKDVLSFIDLLGIDIFRISGYDTTIEIVVNKEKDLFKELKTLISDESNNLKNFLELGEYGDSNKFLFSIEDLNIDSINRINIFNADEVSSCSRTLVKINSNSFSKEDLTILKEIYLRYKNTDSKVNVEDVEDEDVNYLLFFFNNLPKEFFEKISKLFDSIISIEILDGYNEYNTIDSNEQITINSYENQEIENTICIVDSQIEKTNPILNTIVSYGKTYDLNRGVSHGTNVATLAAYGQVQDLGLDKPICNIYGIESLQETFNKINEIIEEAAENGFKIINISQGVGKGNFLRDNDGISEIAKIIDKALVNKDILLLLSSGNIVPSKESYNQLHDEDSNINIPKDSISAISVGAKDSGGFPALYSRKNNIVPSYKIGEKEGRIFRVKEKKSPAFIEYGDNIVFNGTGWYNSKGTSFASPLLGHKAIQILNTYGKISTNTIKALFINYSSQNNIDDSIYSGNKDLLNRHVGWGEINMDKLINEDYKEVNIIIEDFINQNQAKKYLIKLPDINNGENVTIKKSISYNPPVSNTYHLKYSKFSVSAKLWSDAYEEAKNNIFGNPESEDPYSEWKSWKEERGTINRVNYFGTNQMWSSNSSRINYYSYDLYNELKNNTQILIEGHTRNNFKFKQKFSFVMTIDISNLSDPKNFIDNFYELNNDLVIKGEDITNINENINITNKEFEIENDLIITQEDLGNF